MDSSVSPKDEIWFLRVCHHVSTGLYLFGRLLIVGCSSKQTPKHLIPSEIGYCLWYCLLGCCDAAVLEHTVIVSHQVVTVAPRDEVVHCVDEEGRGVEGQR